MRITWNPDEKRFEAQFATGDEWRRDQSAAADSGFHTDGAPAWIWHASKAGALDKLKLKIPVGISLTRPALDAYTRLHAIEQKNNELKAWAKEQKKKLKKEEEREKIKAQADGDGSGDVEPEYEARHFNPIPEYWKGKDEIGRDDLPADFVARLTQHESVPQRRAEPSGTCVMCGLSVYFYEKQDPPTCLWCEGRGEEQFFEELIA